MLYLKSFSIPSEDMEEAYFYPSPEERQRRLQKRDHKIWLTTYSSSYPFNVFRYRQVPTIEFEPITIFYGSNGSGKSTLLNVIAEKLGLHRDAPFNRTAFYEDYVNLCRFSACPQLPDGSRYIASDDIFASLLNIRKINEDIEDNREALFQEYNEANLQAKRGQVRRLQSLSDYQEFARHSEAVRHTQSRFVNDRVAKNIVTQSNGESALRYLMDEIKENCLYLLDEPENSMSPQFQLDLKQVLEDSARFFGCQFVIATHSPFLLAMKGARIYDLDETPPQVKNWKELDSIRTYMDFFAEYWE